MLGHALRNLLAQDFPPDGFEIIVVDDGSIDQTAEVVAAIAAEHAGRRIRYAHQPHSRLSAARNAGLRWAVGDLIAFADDDQEAPPGWLQAIARAAGGYPDAECIGGPVWLRLAANSLRLCGREPVGESEVDWGPHDRLLHPEIGITPLQCLGGGNMVIRRSALDRVGLFDESLPNSGEFDWQLRLSGGGGTILYAADAWQWHRRTDTDLRLRRLIRQRWTRGIGAGIWERHIAWPSTPGGHITVAFRMLVHFVRRRCVWGLLTALFHAGSAYGMLVGSQRRS
jgi:glycosyltransferase involved in cell wall biosynthesis